ncbi:hypothetical protein BsIDN1_46260 [Bacillus safensis]|uniref:Uncharacterized protein n=1 Tax=Bacillus safensis TaxID=561879 RepID=A0A5S9MDE4_BACIA|nr:hypothetical protein BsIDN1_46260 [Bacillus safensis]
MDETAASNEIYEDDAPPLDINNEILMHLRALKKKKKDVSLHDPIGQDKEGNEISLIDVLKSEKMKM